MMVSRVLGTLAAFSGLALLVEDARACVLQPTQMHAVHSDLASGDTVAPARPVLLAVGAFRRSGMTCTAGTCVWSSCGDTGRVEIELAAEDDQTPAASVGYRLELVSGELPESLLGAIGVALAGRAPLILWPSFEDVTALDVTLAAVAIDAAGNESPRSEPFAVQFDGCTLSSAGDRCEDAGDSELAQAEEVLAELLEGETDADALGSPDIEVGAELAGGWDETGAARAASCSVSLPPRGASALAALAGLVASFVLRARRTGRR